MAWLPEPLSDTLTNPNGPLLTHSVHYIYEADPVRPFTQRYGVSWPTGNGVTARTLHATQYAHEYADLLRRLTRRPARAITLDEWMRDDAWADLDPRVHPEYAFLAQDRKRLAFLAWAERLFLLPFTTSSAEHAQRRAFLEGRVREQYYSARWLPTVGSSPVSVRWQDDDYPDRRTRFADRLRVFSGDISRLALPQGVSDDLVEQQAHLLLHFHLYDARMLWTMRFYNGAYNDGLPPRFRTAGLHDKTEWSINIAYHTPHLPALTWRHVSPAAGWFNIGGLIELSFCQGCSQTDRTVVYQQLRLTAPATSGAFYPHVAGCPYLRLRKLLAWSAPRSDYWRAAREQVIAWTRRKRQYARAARRSAGVQEVYDILAHEAGCVATLILDTMDSTGFGAQHAADALQDHGALYASLVDLPPEAWLHSEAADALVRDGVLMLEHYALLADARDTFISLLGKAS